MEQLDNGTILNGVAKEFLIFGIILFLFNFSCMLLKRDRESEKDFVSLYDPWQMSCTVRLTCNLLSKFVSVFELALCFAAFQNCFCAEYRFIGHTLMRQSIKVH